MAGRKPIPMHLKLIRGNPGKRAIRPEPEPVIPPELPDPPDFLLPVAKDEWFSVGPELLRLGLLTVLDIHPFAAYCQAVGRWKQAEDLLAAMAERDPETGALTVKSTIGNAMHNPLLRIATSAAANMIRYAAEFGLTPAARAHVVGGVVARSGGGKFDGLLGG
jgi:P27 family predicted phage terminase small subunit